MQKLEMFWKIQNICYNIGTDIFKIEEEMIKLIPPFMSSAKTPKVNTKNCNFLKIDFFLKIVKTTLSNF